MIGTPVAVQGEVEYGLVSLNNFGTCSDWKKKPLKKKNRFNPGTSCLERWRFYHLLSAGHIFEVRVEAAACPIHAYNSPIAVPPLLPSIYPPRHSPPPNPSLPLNYRIPTPNSQLGTINSLLLPAPASLKRSLLTLAPPPPSLLQFLLFSLSNTPLRH